MDPHDDFDKHDRAPDDAAPATNTAYGAIVRQRDELLAVLRAIAQSGTDANYCANRLAREAIAKAEGK